MKHVLLSVAALSALVAFGQQKQEVEQSGTPALLEVRGRQVKVFLQRMEEGNLTFQLFKKPSDMTVPADKIAKIEFVSKYDADAVQGWYADADYDAVLTVLEPIMEEIAQYMSIPNNMLKPFEMTFEAYRGKKRWDKVRGMADQLVATEDPRLVALAKVALALAAIDAGDFAKAEALSAELESEPAKLYVNASALRAQERPQEAIQVVNEMIFNHPNDILWMPRGELLNAYLYLDMTGTNSVITTNSAMLTARQVKNMYTGENIAGEARRFWVDLGGEPIELAEKAERAEAVARAKALREKRAAEREAEREETRRRRAAEREAAAKANAEAPASTDG